MMTPKQERNGVPGPTAAVNSAQHSEGVDHLATIAAAFSSATSKASHQSPTGRS
jgi:hypothetical protein